MIIVLGVTMLVLGSCGWLLWSYLVEILLDTNKTGFVDLDPPLDVLVFFETHQINSWISLKVMAVLGVTVLVLNTSG